MELILPASKWPASAPNTTSPTDSFHQGNDQAEISNRTIPTAYANAWTKPKANMRINSLEYSGPTGPLNCSDRRNPFLVGIWDRGDYPSWHQHTDTQGRRSGPWSEWHPTPFDARSHRGKMSTCPNLHHSLSIANSGGSPHSENSKSETWSWSAWFRALGRRITRN